MAELARVLEKINERLVAIEERLAGDESDATHPLSDEEPPAKRAREPLPQNVEETTLEIIREDYSDYFMPPVYDGEWGDELTSVQLQDIRRFYTRCVVYAVVEQNTRMDCFVQRVESVLGKTALQLRLRKPFAIQREKEYYFVAGYYVVSETISSTIQEFFGHPDVSKALKIRKYTGNMSNDQFFTEKILPRENAMLLWSNVIANAILLREEAGRKSYVDRERLRMLRDTFRLAKEKAVADLMRFLGSP